MRATTAPAAPIRRTLAALVAVALALGLATLAPGQWQVAAASTMPSSLQPSGGKVAGIPTFSWGWVADSSSYEIEVYTDPEYKNRVWGASTANRQIVPEVQLPTSTLYWQVRAQTPAGPSDWGRASVTRSNADGPALSSPAHGATLAQPSDPVLLQWEPLPQDAATSYEVAIGPDPDFVDPSRVTTYSTKTSSYVVPNPQVATTYFWRVRGALGSQVFTDWSSTRSYQVTSLPPAVSTMPAAPANAQDQLIQDGDMHVDWAPVPGATTYDVQFDDDEDFSSLAHQVEGIPSTRYSPPATLNHDQYYWRVRSRNSLGHVQQWPSRPTGEFERRWSDRIRLLHPIDRSGQTPSDLVFTTPAVVTDPVYFEWEPVKLASRYVLEVSRNRTFTPAGEVSRCSTVHTTFTPSWGNDGTGNGECMPSAGGDYYWRVIGYDEFGSPAPQTDITLGNVEVGRFRYQPPRVQILSPTEGTQVDVPTLTWQALPGAARYQVVIRTQDGRDVLSDVTAGISYTPRQVLEPGHYEWDVISITEDGRRGTSLIGRLPRFEVIAQDPATATTISDVSPTTGSFGRFPTLRWNPVAGASSYRLFVRKDGGEEWTAVPGSFGYPAGEDIRSTFLSPDTYEWQVEARSENGARIAVGPKGKFTIDVPLRVLRPRASLSGQSLARGEVCRTDVAQGCQNLRQTPLLTWDRDIPGDVQAGYWEIYLSRNANLTNLVGSSDGYPIRFPVKTTTNSWIPTVALPSGQSGVAYWWSVRPCTAEGVCGDLLGAVESFNIKALPVSLVGPGDPLGTAEADTVKVRDDVTLSWQDYLATSGNTAAGGPGVPAGYESALSTPGSTEARQYQVQVSGDPTFNGDLWDDRHVDQTSYTSISQTYPEGINYWRVRALDGSGNGLPWSEPRQFVKSSGSPRPTSPETHGDTAVGTATDGLAPLRWEPMDHAASYNVEVYRAGDVNASADNLVLSRNEVRQVALSPENPFPASSEPYVWRVQRVDARGRKGAWSATARQTAGWSSFTVRGSTPRTVTPVAGARVAPLETLFTWAPVPGATAYRFQRRRPGTSGIDEDRKTPALAWTPRQPLGGGQWEWRVVALDANERDLSSSAWVGFSVATAPQATTPPRIEGPGLVGTLVTGTAPVWDLPGVSTTYQWLRDGSSISGATGLAYTMTPEDEGRQLSLRATGRLPGYSDGEIWSSPLTAATGAAARATVAPSVAGSGRVGEVLTRNDVAWDLPDVRTEYRWTVDGQVQGADGPTFAVTADHLGKALAVRVVGTKRGHATATVTSNTVTAVSGPALEASAPPHVTGDARVGGRLDVSRGTWPSGTRLTYQWLRNGTAIPDARGDSYQVGVKAAAQDLSVVVVASLAGYADGTSTSSPVKIPKMVSTTHAVLSAKKITRKDRATITVSVSVDGLGGPVGPVMVKAGRKKLVTTVLKESQGGSVTLTLPRLKKPKNKIKVYYVGTAQISGSTSRALKLVVKKGGKRKR